MRYRIFLQAREEYRIMKYHKQVEWAVRVVKRQYVQWKVCGIVSSSTSTFYIIYHLQRRQFLLTLPLRLPINSSSPLCIEWAVAPRFLTETSQLLRNIYHRWRVLESIYSHYTGDFIDFYLFTVLPLSTFIRPNITESDAREGHGQHNFSGSKIIVCT